MKRPNNAGSVVKLKQKNEAGEKIESKFWYILYRHNGKQIRESSKSTVKGAAEALLQRRLHELREGMRPAQETYKLKYEQVRDSYVSEFRNKGGYFIEYADGTSYIQGLPHLDKFFKGIRVSSITTDLLRKFIDKRREQGASDPTIRRNLVILRGMLNLARKENRLRFADVPFFPMPKDSEPIGQYIDPENFSKLRTFLPEELQPFFTFMYGTGCRLGAAKAITWDMISRDRTEIRIPAELMKARQPLVLVLAGSLLEPLSAMLKKMFPTKGPVFCSKNYRPEWSKACAKVPGLGTYDKKTRTRTGVRIHDCRCSAAINLVDAGVPEDIVMKIGGWKTKAMFSRYNVLNTDRIRAAMIKGGEYVKERMKIGVSK